MANHKLPFLIDRKEVILIKPSKPTPSDVLSFSTIDNDYNLELLCQTVYVYQARVPSSEIGHDHDQNSSPSSHSDPASLIGSDHHDQNSNSKSHSDPACLIKEALSKALVYYYPLSGKLKRHDDGRLRLTCNADGVPFLEATANCELSSLNHFEGIDVETAKNFVFNWPSDSKDGYHPLVLQLTKFSCGGFTIGMGLYHSVCDGFGAAQFFRAMAELASGKTEPSVKPVWERERLVAKPIEGPIQLPVENSSLAKSPYLPPADLVHESFNVSAESIKRLKMRMMKECENMSLTTIEVLGAYVWRSRTRALELDSTGKTFFCMAMGIRRLWNPPLPHGYYGNAFLSSYVVMTVRDLCEEPLSKVVKLIKESKKVAASSEFMTNLLSSIEKVRELKMSVGGSGASMVLTDWRQLSLLEEVDFGWKASVNVVPLPWDMFGYVDLCIFMPPCRLDASMEGGVRVMVSLPSAAMPKFREEMDALWSKDENGLH